MNTPFCEHPDTPSPDGNEAKPSFWLRLGGGSLSVSILIHAVLLVIGVIWIYQVIPQKPPESPWVSAGRQPGGTTATPSSRAPTLAMTASRIRAQDAVSELVLPQPGAASSLVPVGTLGAGSLDGGIGGKGTGFAPSSGIGPGPRQGLAGDPASTNPFGMADPNANALVGVFYDTKQNPKGKDTGMDNTKILEAISNFTTRGWNERLLADNYFQAPQKLYQTKIYMPMISADEAPRAFNCGKEVKGRFWVVVYRGSVIAPKSGKFRFVGAADDLIAVRFNKRNVFEHGYFQATTGVNISSRIAVLEGREKDREFEKQVRASPMRPPVTFYHYDSTQSYQGIGGLAVGPEFEVTEGTSYPIDILISEVPGGLFGAVLMVQESGVAYGKASSGAPILPIFRTAGTLPPEEARDNAPPYDPHGPVWKISGVSQPGI